MRRWLWVLLLVLAVWLAVVVGQTVSEIERQAIVDEARASDVIVTLGAAEYNGRPSPVLRLRLNHALELWREGYAPLIMTTGGAGGDPVFTEAAVGRSYLIGHGVPSEAIVVETEGESTVHSTALAGEIIDRMDLHSVIVVSDGYHIFRVKKMLQHRGLEVYGSPRREPNRDALHEHWNYVKQAIGYVLWRAGVAV